MTTEVQAQDQYSQVLGLGEGAFFFCTFTWIFGSVLAAENALLFFALSLLDIVSYSRADCIGDSEIVADWGFAEHVSLCPACLNLCKSGSIKQGKEV